MILESPENATVVFSRPCGEDCTDCGDFSVFDDSPILPTVTVEAACSGYPVDFRV